ncbi:hypothetical protein NDU88_001763 [Pleurodeles waltl]|uniref:Secreted protein n=1 Tax=Pleurodeles waltl TaxID=8319 RepID=A0AAV7T0Z4_PLEWA|nr:hypothetical protein NDU88_001763 [Pleurodeles waltl]
MSPRWSLLLSCVCLGRALGKVQLRVSACGGGRCTRGAHRRIRARSYVTVANLDTILGARLRELKLRKRTERPQK